MKHFSTLEEFEKNYKYKVSNIKEILKDNGELVGIFYHDMYNNGTQRHIELMKELVKDNGLLVSLELFRNSLTFYITDNDIIDDSLFSEEKLLNEIKNRMKYKKYSRIVIDYYPMFGESVDKLKELAYKENIQIIIFQQFTRKFTNRVLDDNNVPEAFVSDIYYHKTASNLFKNADKVFADYYSIIYEVKGN